MYLYVYEIEFHFILGIWLWEASGVSRSLESRHSWLSDRSLRAARSRVKQRAGVWCRVCGLWRVALVSLVPSSAFSDVSSLTGTEYLECRGFTKNRWNAHIIVN